MERVSKRFSVRVKTNQPEARILEHHPGELIVALKARPIEGNANLELVKLLRKHFKKDVRIVSGLKSRQKIVELLE